MCWEGFCWNFNLTGPQKNPAMRHKSLLLVLLWSCLLPGLSLRSPVGPAQNAFMVGTVYGINTFTLGVGRLLIKHCVFWNRLRCLPSTHHPQKHTGFQYFRVCEWTDGHFRVHEWGGQSCAATSAQFSRTAAFGSCRCSEASNLQPAQIT